MRRRLIALVPAALLAVAGSLLVPPSPASAAGACVGEGSMTTGGLFYPVMASTVPPSITVRGASIVPFTLSLSVGTCVHQSDGTATLGSFGASGLMSGWCGLSSGTGVTTFGGRFSWIGVGGLLVATGDLTGVIASTPAPGTGSCLTTGATLFLASGVGLTLHCVKTFPHNGSLLLTVPIPTTWTLPVPFLHIQTHPWHLWVKTCLYTPIL